MLPKNKRLKRDEDIKKVLRKGRFFKQKFLKIKCRPNELELSRFATPVGLKVSKKAVTRNKIKRRLQEILRKNWKKIVPGYDVLVMVEPDIKNKKYQEIRQNLIELLEQAEIKK